MSSRTIMYVPSNFTVEKGANIKFVDCNIKMHNGINMLHANIFRNNFSGNLTFEELDVYTEDNPIVFIDKIESYITQEERLV